MPSDIPENGADDFDEILVIIVYVFGLCYRTDYIQMENGLSKFHLWKYESSVSTAIFIDVDKLAVATEGKVCFNSHKAELFYYCMHYLALYSESLY